MIQIGGKEGREEERGRNGDREVRERERSGISKAKQLPTLPVRRGHIFTPQNVGRRATACGMRATPPLRRTQAYIYVHARISARMRVYAIYTRAFLILSTSITASP